MSKFEKWFKLHPKVQAALIALGVVAYTAFDDAYNSSHDYKAAAKIAGGAAIVWLVAYLRSSKPSA